MNATAREMTMNRFPFRPNAVVAILAAVLALFVTTGLLGSVTALLLRNGVPLQNDAAAERACGDVAYASERDACVRAFRSSR